MRIIVRRFWRELRTAQALCYALAVVLLVALFKVSRARDSEIVTAVALLLLIAVGVWTGNILTHIITPLDPHERTEDPP